MKKHTHLIVSALALMGGTLSAAHATPKPKPAPKKPPVKAPAAPVVRGMNQLDGQNAKIGQTFTLGKNPAINFTLTGAHYAVERTNIGQDAYPPAVGEKLLVLDFTVHNPNKFELNYDWGMLGFTAVDAQNVNHEYVSNVGDPASKERLSIVLKPAQKAQVYTAIKVPAKGVIPKLIVKFTYDGVLRYDLRDQVKELEAPFADPADKTGASALSEITGTPDRYYPLLGYDAKLVKTEFSAGPLGENAAEEGNRFFITTITFKNAAPYESNYDFGTFVPELLDADGENVSWGQILLKSGRPEPAGGRLKPGQEYTARFVWQVPNDLRVKTLRFSEPDSRVVAFNVNATQ
jgi:hypothetical protein